MVALFVILTVIAFIAIDALVQRAEAREQRRAQPTALTSRERRGSVLALEGVSVPQGMFFDVGHTWVDLDSSGRVRVGVDDFAQRAIGRIDAVEMPEVGRPVRRGETLFVVRQGERTAAFVAPVDGVVAAVNERLARHADAIKIDPYEQGWVCVLRPRNLAQHLRRLAVAGEATTWMNKEIERFRQLIAAHPFKAMARGQVLQDGGRLTDGVLEMMDDETWSRFTREFLHPDEWARA